MNPTNTTTPSPAGIPTRATAALLLAAAGTLLAQVPSASATTFAESTAPGGDFGDTFALRTTLTLGTTVVNGGISNGGSDPDFFTITGLAGNTTYSLSISAGDSIDGYSATFQGYDDVGAAIGTSAAYVSTDPPNTTRSITGTIPASGILTIGVNPQSVPFVEGGNPVYTATLTAVPEPGTTSLVALGAALAALTARRHRKPTDTAAVG